MVVTSPVLSRSSMLHPPRLTSCNLPQRRTILTFLRGVHYYRSLFAVYQSVTRMSSSNPTPLSSSPDKVVECVPNFSEGRRTDVIEAIASAIRGSEGCTLLDVDPGQSTNRTVYTFVGSPLAVVEGALLAARAAHKLIDMSKHHGMQVFK